MRGGVRPLPAIRAARDGREGGGGQHGATLAQDILHGKGRFLILPRQGEVAPKATEGAGGDALSDETPSSSPSVTLRVPPPPGGGGFGAGPAIDAAQHARHSRRHGNGFLPGFGRTAHPG